VEMDHLKAKVDAGANYIVTQLFFDNRDFYDFRERCDLAGIRIPIIAGIMPITSMSGCQRIAELAGGAPTDFHMTLPLNAAAEQEAAAILKAHGIDDGTLLLGLQPGASTTSRRWAPAHFVELARQLLAAHPELRIVVTGSAQEKTRCREIAAAIGRERAWASAGEVPLRLLPARIKRCFTRVTGDTGPMHLAVAVETPVVALFAVSDARRSGPAYDLDRHTVIQKWRTCDPCLSKDCPYPLPICMENITLEEVGAAVERQFSAFTGARHGD